MDQEKPIQKPQEPAEEGKEKASEHKMEVAKQHLRAELESHKIPWQDWGKGTAKTFDHLLKEIEEGETKLSIDEKGELLREVSVMYADVFYRDESGIYKLVEDRQEFKDGRTRKRPYLEGSVAEKMKQNENPAEVVQRALEEELGITGDVTINGGDVKEVVQDSPSYPGLKSKFINYKFAVTIGKNQFKPEGYKEEQPDKTTFFVWVKQEVPPEEK